MVSLIANPHLVYGVFSNSNIIESTRPGFNNQFGYKLDSDNNRVLIADYSRNAYLYTGKLSKLPLPAEDKLFEPTLDINSHYMAVAYVSTHYDNLDGAGILYLFDENGEYISSIYPPEPINWGHFGSSVLLGEELIYIGEAWADNIELDEGIVHRFTYNGTYIDSMTAPEPSYAAAFGARLEGNSEWLVVSEINGVHGMLNNGEVHLYSWSGELIHTLGSLNSSMLNDFGASVALSEEFIVIGESISQIDYFERAGRVYLYDVNGELLYILESPIPVNGGLFGFSVAINDNYIAVGEPRANGKYPLEGAVHIYNLDGEYVETLFSPLGESNSEFGKSLCFSDGKLYVGQPGANVNSLVYAGRVIEYSPTTPGIDPENMTLVYEVIVGLAIMCVLFFVTIRAQRAFRKLFKSTAY